MRRRLPGLYNMFHLYLWLGGLYLKSAVRGALPGNILALSAVSEVAVTYTMFGELPWRVQPGLLTPGAILVEWVFYLLYQKLHTSSTGRRLIRKFIVLFDGLRSSLSLLSSYIYLMKDSYFHGDGIVDKVI